MGQLYALRRPTHHRSLPAISLSFRFPAVGLSVRRFQSPFPIAVSNRPFHSPFPIAVSNRRFQSPFAVVRVALFMHPRKPMPSILELATVVASAALLVVAKPERLTAQSCPLHGSPQIRPGDAVARSGGRFDSSRDGGRQHG